MSKKFPLPMGAGPRRVVRDHRDAVKASEAKRAKQGFRRIALLVHADDAAAVRKYVTQKRKRKMKELGLAV